MRNLIIELLVNAATLAIAATIVPWMRFTGPLTSLLALAVIFGLLNTFLRPLMKLAAFPINILTFGLFTLVVNAVLLLLLAMLSDTLKLGLHVGGFPPSFSLGTLGAAIASGLVISVVASALNLIFDRAR